MSAMSLVSFLHWKNGAALSLVFRATVEHGEPDSKMLRSRSGNEPAHGGGPWPEVGTQKSPQPEFRIISELSSDTYRCDL